MHRFLFLFVLLPLLNACSPQVISQEGCSLPGDCPATETCVNGACVEGETDVRPCTPETEEDDCGVGAYCSGERCATSPTCDEGCPTGFVCNGVTNLCARDEGCGECANDSFCDGLETCDPNTGNCIPGDPPCGGSVDRCDEETRTCGCLTNDDCEAPQTCNGFGVCECIRDCEGKTCGDDKCGGTCGTCNGGDECNDNGNCECIPNCAGKTCGSDGCDGSCGNCLAPQECNDFGICECTPDCDGRVCGDDGCGGTCGSCQFAQECSANGQCDCVADCFDKECGDDGCGGSCGTCDFGDTCNLNSSQCGCVPNCNGSECGGDGCGGICGECLTSQTCEAGQCEFSGTLCDVLTDPFVLGEYQSQSGDLNADIDQEYIFDSRPVRYIDSFTLDLATAASEGSSVDISLTSGTFDTVLYVFRVDNGCNQVAKNDDGGQGQNSLIENFSPVPGAQYEAIVTSFAEATIGPFNFSVTIPACGAEFEDQAAYEKCMPRIRSLTCNNNPCVAGATTEFCCVNQSCRADHNNEITVQNDNSGTCN